MFMPVVYAAIASLFIGFGGGYSLRGLMADADQANAIKQALSATKAQIKESSRIEKVYLEGETKTETIYKTIIKEVPKYVTVIQKEDSDCNLSNGSVGLLKLSAAGRLPHASAIADAASQAASDVREADLINYANEIIHQYNQAMSQCNALIGWVDGVSKISELNK